MPRKILPYELADAPGEELLAQFLASAPTEPELYNASQTIVSAGRLDLLRVLYDWRGRWPCSMRAAMGNAARGGFAEIVAFLLERSDEPVVEYALDDAQESALLDACLLGRTACARLLIGAGASVDLFTKWMRFARDASFEEEGFSPLLNAIRAGEPELVELVLGAGVDLTRETCTGKTPLEFARLCGVEPVIELLDGANAEGE